VNLIYYATHYSPGNLRAVTDNSSYRMLMNHWLDNAYTMRYSGCMVADIHHVFTKGQGIFTNIGGNKYPNGKLRLVFEVGPFAEVAGVAEVVVLTTSLTFATFGTSATFEVQAVVNMLL